MKKTLFTLAIAILALSTTSFAQAPKKHLYYAITNDDNPDGNTATVFEFDGSAISVIQTLHTGGTGLGGGYYSESRVAIENSGKCLFVSDAGSDDIAAFAETSRNPLKFNPTPNLVSTGSSSRLGIGLAATPDGKLLFASLDVSEQIGIFEVGDGCTLTKLGDITEHDYIGPMGMSNDGKVLIVPESDNSVVDAFSISKTPPYLWPLGTSISFGSVPGCSSVGCYPASLDISTVKNGKATVVEGNATLSGPYYFTMRLDEETGLSESSVTLNELTGTTLGDILNPWYSSAGLTGNGLIYFGATGDGYSAGISANKVTAGVINPASAGFYVLADDGMAGNIQSTGHTATQGKEYVWQTGVGSYNTVNVYKSNGTGKIILFRSINDPNGSGTPVYSITAYPKR
jgi:hypothetical protein